MEKPCLDVSYRKSRLASGITLVTEELPHVRSAALGIWVFAGSRDEEPAEHGLAHLVEHLIFKGTRNRSASRIAMEVDALGGHIDAFTSREMTCFYITVLDHKLDTGCELLADIFLNSLFDERELELERGVVLEEIRMAEDTPDDHLHDLMMAAVWGGNPMARPIAGTLASVSSFRRPEVVAFFDKHYHAGKVILACAGSVPHDEAQAVVGKRFGALPIKGDTPPRVKPSFHRGVVRMEKPLNQVYIDIALPGIPQTHPLRYSGFLLNTILGGSLSSRLFQKIREERGLVYSIYSGLTAHLDAGLLNVSASTSPALARQVTELIVQELDALRREPPTDDEIARAKDHLIGNLVLSMEGTQNRMTKLGKQELYFNRYVPVEESIAALQVAGRESLAETAALFLQPAEMTYGFLGPAEGIPKDEELPSW